MEKLMVLNPCFNPDGRKVVIWGTGRMALLLHTTMIQEDVYIDAFCSDAEQVIGSKIMGKEVIPLEKVRLNSDEYLILVGDENLEAANQLFSSEEIGSAWADARMYSLVNDCVWSFM